MSSGEIRKVPKRERREKNQPKIVGAAPIRESQEPKVLDHSTKSKPVEMQTKQHGEVVTVRSHIRTKPTRKDEPDVRLRTMTRQEREDWNKIRNLEWEPE